MNIENPFIDGKRTLNSIFIEDNHHFSLASSLFTRVEPYLLSDSKEAFKDIVFQHWKFLPFHERVKVLRSMIQVIRSVELEKTLTPKVSKVSEKVALMSDAEVLIQLEKISSKIITSFQRSSNLILSGFPYFEDWNRKSLKTSGGDLVLFLGLLLRFHEPTIPRKFLEKKMMKFLLQKEEGST